MQGLGFAPGDRRGVVPIVMKALGVAGVFGVSKVTGAVGVLGMSKVPT